MRSLNLFVPVATTGNIPFEEARYNMDCAVVSKALDKKYRYVMCVPMSKGVRCAHEHPVDYDVSDTDSATDSDTEPNSCDHGNTSQPGTSIACGDMGTVMALTSSLLHCNARHGDGSTSGTMFANRIEYKSFEYICFDMS